MTTYLYNKICSLARKPVCCRLLQGMVRFRLPLIIGVHLALFAVSWLLTFVMLRELILSLENDISPWPSLAALLVIRFAVF